MSENRIANSLQAHGIRAGHKVCVLLPNGPEFVLTYYALQKLGAVLVSLNVMLKQREIAYVANDAQASTFIGHAGRERFGHPIVEGYGLTETSPFAAFNTERHFKPGSVGTPIENVEIKIVDKDDHGVPRGELGEIIIRGPNVMKGYFARPEDTAIALRGGWFHSGDIGRVDADGYLYIVDRVKDMINVGGFKVWPREIEEVLFEHSAVRECAVIGVPDAAYGETVKAFVVVRDEVSVEPEALIAHCAERIATYKVPRSVEFIAALPKSPTGKILKRELRDRLVARV